MRSLGICLHGEPGTGKSWLGATAPAYRLVLDCEGGSRYTKEKKVYWNPAEPPPVPGSGREDPNSPVVTEVDWRTCIVITRNFATMGLVYGWLNSGQHPFRSLVIDSITELQKRLVDDTAGVAQPTQQDWGAILRIMEAEVRKLRDLLFHETRPLECVVLIALTHQRDGKFRPFVKGQLELSLPGFIDVVGFLYVDMDADQQMVRKLLIAPVGEFDAKDRTDALTVAYGPVIVNPNLETMIEIIDQAT